MEGNGKQVDQHLNQQEGEGDGQYTSLVQPSGVLPQEEPEEEHKGNLEEEIQPIDHRPKKLLAFDHHRHLIEEEKGGGFRQGIGGGEVDLLGHHPRQDGHGRLLGQPFVGQKREEQGDGDLIGRVLPEPGPEVHRDKEHRRRDQVPPAGFSVGAKGVDQDIEAHGLQQGAQDVQPLVHPHHRASPRRFPAANSSTMSWIRLRCRGVREVTSTTTRSAL